MEKEATLEGLKKIKDLFTDDKGKADPLKIGLPVGALALLGGGILMGRKLGSPVKAVWKPGQREGLVNRMAAAVSAEM